MPLIAIDAAGKRRPATPGARLGGGASAEVFQEIGGHGMALKLYSPDYLSKYGDQRERILAMLERPPSGQEVPYKGRRVVQIAWPREILQDSNNGRFVGFSMPLVDKSGAVEMEILKTRINRRQCGLREDLTFRLNVVRNLAALVNEVHRVGHTIADLKPLNLMVYKDTGFVAILDCDGFGIRSRTRTFPGALGTDGYRAPECAHMPSAQFGPKQDEFALAVIIWELLNDAHPFTGRPRRPISNTAQERIYEGLYAYGLKGHMAIEPIPTSQHATWPTPLRQMFDNAFAGQLEFRPTAKKWRDALEALKAKLQRCPRDLRHEYFSDSCPYCPFIQTPADRTQGVWPPAGSAGSSGSQRKKSGGSVPHHERKSGNADQLPWKRPRARRRSHPWQLLRWSHRRNRNTILGLGAGVAVTVVGILAFRDQGAATVRPGPAVVNTVELYVRSCPAPVQACHHLMTLDEGDGVFVTKALSNGWSAVTVQHGGRVIRGFVNGTYLTPR